MKTGRKQRAIGNRNKHKLFYFTLRAMLFALYFSAEAQQQKEIRKIASKPRSDRISNPSRVLARADKVIK